MDENIVAFEVAMVNATLAHMRHCFKLKGGLARTNHPKMVSLKEIRIASDHSHSQEEEE